MSDFKPNQNNASFPLRVLHLISSRGLYGAERVVINLAADVDRRRAFPLMALLQDTNSPNLELVDAVRHKGAPTHIIPCRRWIDMDAIRTVRRLIRTARIDVVHSHEMKGRLFALLAAAGTKARIMATHHNWIRSDWRVACFESLDGFYIRFFPRIVAVSPEVGTLMRKYGIPKRNLTVIINGIDMSEFQKNEAARERIRRELNIGPEIPLIGTIGRISPEKGHEYFVAAAAQTLKAVPAARFIIVGDGPQREATQQVAAASGVADRVIFAGFQRQVAEFYAAFDVFVLPSLLEGTPMALLEAMAAELPVVATRVGGVGRIIRHQINGLLTPAGSAADLAAAIVYLLQHPSAATRLTANAMRTVTEKYSSQRMCREYEQVYENLVSGRSEQRKPGR